MGKNKLKKYNVVETFSNVIKSRINSINPLKLDNTWNQNLFKRKQEVILELGCGRGEYAISLARKYPKKNFIGIDIKGARIWHGASTALEEKLDNIIFLRIRIEHLDLYFSEKIISEIWITFPDPYINKLNGKRRLTSQRFLDIYKKILKKKGAIHLKTDDEELYTFTMGNIKNNSAHLIQSTNDLYNSSIKNSELTSIKTTYEKIYLSQSKKIKYLKFEF